jgi:magnesium chelatase subunit D
VSCDYDAEELTAARVRLPTVTISDEQVEALCGIALALGIPSLRASIFACRAACAAAALAEREAVTEADLAVAGRLVLAPRATQLPPMEPPPDAEPPPPEPEEPEQNQNQETEQQEPQELQDQILEATKAAIPAGLLAQLQMGKLRRSRSRATGKAGAMQNAQTRGRPAGVLRGEPRAGLRLNVVETLRAAAPWQRLRREERERCGQTSTRIEVRQDDFRITRFKHKSETTTIFVVDASGSSALHRLAEAKGAVELLLADCYVRRDKVALVAFRGQAAEVLLPPTRSLVRAKRSLAGLPGGGGTPLASGIDLGMILADSIKRRGGTPVLIVMTDGRANVARDGSGGRTRANEEALGAARVVRGLEITALVIDTSPRPQPQGRELAKEMGAIYLPLPHADANSLTQAVRATAN